MSQTADSALPEHLQKAWGNSTVDPRVNPAFCVKQSRKTPAIPWHNGYAKCLSCGLVRHAQIDSSGVQS